MPKPRCLSPAANSLDVRIAECQVPKPRCLSPAANSLDVRIAECQVPKPRCIKRPTKIALAHFAWHFIVGKPWDSITIIAKKLCFGVHAQVSFLIVFNGFHGFPWFLFVFNRFPYFRMCFLLVF